MYFRQTVKFSARPLPRVVHMEGSIPRARTMPVEKKTAVYPAHRSTAGRVRFQDSLHRSSLGSREANSRKATIIAKVMTCLASGV